jgi:hypothetical protein
VFCLAIIIIYLAKKKFAAKEAEIEIHFLIVFCEKKGNGRNGPWNFEGDFHATSLFFHKEIL